MAFGMLCGDGSISNTVVSGKGYDMLVAVG